MEWNKEPLGSSGKKNEIPLCLNIKREITSDPERIAEEINMLFVNVASKLVSKLKAGNTKFHEYLITQYSNNFFMSPVTTHEVNSLLANLI